MKRCRRVSSCSNPAAMTPMRSQLSLHHRLTHNRGCDVEPNVKMNCLAYTVDVIVEGQSVVYGHTETLYCSCNSNSNAGDYNVVDLWF